MKKNERLVAAINNGTVIDHIPPSKTYQVASLLHLIDEANPVTIGYNYPSSKMGRKGIIKVSNRFFTTEEINKLSVIAPNIIINVIKDYEVVEKIMVSTPDTLIGIVKCNNPKCVTNNEPMPTVFHVSDKEHGIIHCHYCDKEQEMGKAQLV